MTPSDRERRLDALRRTLRTHEQERAQDAEAADPVAGDALLARVAVELRAVDAGQLDQCRRDLDEAAARGESLTLSRALLTRGVLDAAALDRLEGVWRRRRAEIPRPERYEVREVLGEGGTATVYGAWDRELRRPVALKVLKGWVEADPEARERFAREARAAARLTHPHVVAVHDVTEVDGRPLLVLEKVEGTTWARGLAEGRGDLRTHVAILEKVARAVHEAHRLGIVHRDLKPGNVLLAPSGEPKVADFGLARAPEGESMTTRSGTVLGTPPYMAPEQVEGRGEIDARTDVYALGAILYELLTGRPPHVGAHLPDLLRRICDEEPPPPRRLAPDAPDELAAVSLRALDKLPARRYPDAAEFAEELRRWAAGEPVRARPQGTASRVYRRAARHPRTVAAVTVLALLAGGLGAWGWANARWRADRSTDTATRLAQAREGFRRWMIGTATARLEGRDPAAATAREQLARAIADDAMAVAGAADAAVDGSTREWCAAAAGLLQGGPEEAARRAGAAAPLAPPDAAVDLHILAGCANAVRANGLFADLAEQAACRDRAMHDLGEAIRLRPEAGFARLMRAAFGFDLLDDVVRNPGALWEDADAAVRADPDLPEARIYRAIALHARGETAAAEDDLAVAIRLAPTDAAAFWQRGMIRSEEDRDLPGAIADFDEALRRLPGFVSAWFHRGIARHQAGRAGAIDDFTRALELDPRLTYAYYYRSLAHEAAGDRAAARADAERGLAQATDEQTRATFTGLRKRLEGE